MTTINGSYNSAVVYADTVEESAAEQIERLCSQPFAAGRRIRVMPDVHAGVGCVIGFTANLGEMVIPNIMGVDIGCGMLTVELGGAGLDFKRLDNIIRTYIPSGRNVHEGRTVRFDALTSLICYRSLRDTRRIERSIGTLGGGNHFIEVGEDEGGGKYLVVHTGSRNLGKQVAEHYQAMAYDLMCGKDELFSEQKRIIAEYKAAGRKSEIKEILKELKKTFKAKEPDIPRELCYLTGEYRSMYLADMAVCQAFASANRHAIAGVIIERLMGGSLTDYPSFETVHNYIDLESNIVRKGAVSAKAGERLLIPINMRDGSLICMGLGNEEWNCSAPHGAGRLFSRSAAREKFTVEQFRQAMEGVFTTSVGEATLDECPMVYKSMDEIAAGIGPTAVIDKRIKPVYNFKAGE
ncbi:MAG: RtcB family protein [Eubacteriales bacterium]|nr:RtcB family protein [Eubacteriales bacterium]